MDDSAGIPPGGKRSLAAAREVLLEERLRSRLAGRSSRRIPPRPPGIAVPLSVGQERLWFLDRLEGGNASYHIFRSFRLSGLIDIPALWSAAADLSRRHEALRTTVVASDSPPRQEISPLPRVETTLIDLGRLSSARRLPVARALAAAAALRPFSLATGPLFRLQVLRLGPKDHVLCLTLHHVIADGWSLAIVLRELAELYRAALTRQTPALPRVVLQAGDHALWERVRASDAEWAQDVAYWRQRLRGLPALLELPTDRPWPSRLSSRGAELRRALPTALTDGLRQLAGASSATQFMVLATLLGTLLGRHSGQASVALGTPVAGRDRRELEQMVGFFVRSLVLRLDLATTASFIDQVAQTRQRLLEATRHQQVPFAHLVEKLTPERSLSQTPFFQVMLSLHPDSIGGLELAGMASESFAVRRSVARFALELEAADRPTGLELIWRYSTDLFDSSTVVRLARHFETLAEAVVGLPRRPLESLDLLPVSERHQVLVEASDTGWPAPAWPALHQGFEEQARQQPQAEALIWGEERWTYGALEEQANRLAWALRARGVGPETRVGICLERSPRLVTAMLAVLKTGAAYVPLDPAYPAARIAAMLEDSAATWVLMEATTATLLPAAAWRTLDLDRAEIELARRPAQSVAWAATSQALAYVIYTSGSTGRPKGVAISHTSAGTRVHWARQLYRPEELHGVLAATSICFDLSIFELFVPLSCGGRVILARDALALPSLAAAGEVRLINTVPSAIDQLARSGHLPASIETINLAGEPLPRSVVDRLYEAGVERVYNLYGPSEDTTYSTATRVPIGPERPRIGRPLPGTRAYIVARDLRPVPLGVAGELLLAGAGLARGYLGQPGQTAGRFLPDPFAVRPGERAYRTGDRVRRLADGELDFLGRLDHQVKVRGFRIELGEVETVLDRLPEISEAAVVVREDRPGDRRLVAYVVAAEGHGLTAGDLRAAVATRLPEYMVPSGFQVLSALPRAPNGKVDRRALLALQSELPEASAAYVPPRGPLEEIVASIWAEVLGLGPGARVGAHDHFFELGGHSLLATQVVSRLRRSLGVELDLRQVFEAPTVADLAARLSAARALDVGPPREPALVASARPGGVARASFAQERLWFLDQLESDPTLYNLPVAFRLEGPVDVDRLRAALLSVARRHEMLRTRFMATGDGVVQVISASVELVMPLEDLRALTATARQAEVRRTITGELQRAFDLERGPLWRTRLLWTGTEAYVLLVTLHHIAADGWSVGVLAREILDHYAAEGSSLPDLPVQVADYAVWQRRYLSGEVLERQLAYWRQRLAAMASLLELPTDRPRPAVMSGRGGTVTLQLEIVLLNALRSLAQRSGASLFMVLLAAFQALLGRLTGHYDVPVGAPIAGRDRLEIEGLIGLFVNTLVLRGDLSGDPTFSELLRRVRQETLAAYAHQEVPFERLVEELAPARSLDHAPLFQVLLALDNTPPASRSHAGLRFETFEIEEQTAKYDLGLACAERHEGLRCRAVFRRDLFDTSTVRRLLGQLRAILEAVTVDPDQRLAELPLLTAGERQQMLVEWNDVVTAYPAAATVPSIFRHQAARTPDAVALVSAEGQLDYGALDRRSSQLAGYLAAIGVGRESLVGLCLERSIDAVVAILGILKTGGAYVPLDPDYPAERLAFMLADTSAEVLVTSSAGGRALPPELAVAGLRIVDLAADEIATSATSDFMNIGDPDQLAYVMYTSGSTGRPKGVAVTHRNILRLVFETNYARFGPQEIFLLFAPISFDASTLELWGPLLHGGKLAVFTSGPASLSALGAAIAEHQVTTLWLTAGLFHQMVEENLEALRPVRQLLAGGDVLAPEKVAQVLTELPDTTLINGYGPTETSAFPACRPPRRWHRC